jgi:hypothetical protein
MLYMDENRIPVAALKIKMNKQPMARPSEGKQSRERMKTDKEELL